MSGVVGQRRIINGYGEPVAQALTAQRNASLAFDRLVLGVVLFVNHSDAEENRTAIQTADRRGYLHTATVLVVEDGRSSNFPLANVIITPNANVGIDNYCEQLPRGSTTLVTGQAWNGDMNNINPFDLDGDWCIVGFLGGSLDSPFILRWWPHPRNKFDPATSANRNPSSNGGSQRYLDQKNRYFQRINGAEFTITQEGTIYLSTHLSNAAMSFGDPVTSTDGRFPRTVNEDTGGSFKAWIKPSQSFELDFNLPANGIGVLDLGDPNLAQPNPSNPGRATQKDNTYLLIEKDRFLLETPDNFTVESASRILLSSDENTTIKVGGDLTTEVTGDTNLSTDGDKTETITGNSSTTVSADLEVVVTQATSVDMTGSCTVSSADSVTCTVANNLDITCTQYSINSTTTAIAGTNITLASGGSGAPGSIAIQPAGVTIGSGSLGGVVGGTFLLQAVATFAASVAAAQASATVETAYALALTNAAAALAASITSAISTTTTTG